MSVYHRVRHQNTKKHREQHIWGTKAKAPVWRNKTTFPKTCLLSVYELLRAKTLKHMQNFLYEEKNIIKETNILSVLRLLRKKTRKCMGSTLND